MAHTGVSIAALERAVSVINKILSRTQIGSANDIPAHSKKQGKWVKFTVKGKGKAAVSERCAAGRSVAKYLALPIDEYSLLNPTWIEREPGSDTFCLSAPLRGITGVDLEPRIWVSVTPDPVCGSVSFSSEQASLGDPSLDERFSLSLKSTLTYVGDERSHHSASDIEESSALKEMLHDKEVYIGDLTTSNPVSSSSGGSRSINEQEIADSTRTSDSLTSLANINRKQQELGSAAAEEAHQAITIASTSNSGRFNEVVRTGHLQASAKIVAKVRLGPPLNVVPGFLLSYTGGLVATALLQALMPTLLELLSRDYERWADGHARQSDGQSKALSDRSGSEVLAGF
ncbi:g8750 [Coccomyxa elongata]